MDLAILLFEKRFPDRRNTCVGAFQILNEIAQHKIKIYEFPDCEDEEENKHQKKLRVSRCCPPVANDRTSPVAAASKSRISPSACDLATSSVDIVTTLC